MCPALGGRSVRVFDDLGSRSAASGNPGSDRTTHDPADLRRVTTRRCSVAGSRSFWGGDPGCLLPPQPAPYALQRLTCPVPQGASCSLALPARVSAHRRILRGEQRPFSEAQWWAVPPLVSIGGWSDRLGCSAGGYSPGSGSGCAIAVGLVARLYFDTGIDCTGGSCPQGTGTCASSRGRGHGDCSPRWAATEPGAARCGSCWGNGRVARAPWKKELDGCCGC